MVLDTVQASGVRLPGSKDSVVIFGLRVLTKEEQCLAGLIENLLALLVAQLCIDVIKSEVLGETAPLSYSCFQLCQGELPPTEAHEKTLVDKW